MPLNAYLYLVCPSCNGQIDGIGYAEHLAPLRPGDTYVHTDEVHHGVHCRTCGLAYVATFARLSTGDLDVDLQRFPKGDRGRYAVLMYLPPERVARGLYLLLDRTGDPSRYWYEEGTCPTNFTDEIVRVFDPDPGAQSGHLVEDDPHGLLDLVGYLAHQGDRTQAELDAFRDRWLGIVERLIKGEDPALLQPDDAE